MAMMLLLSIMISSAISSSSHAFYKILLKYDFTLFINAFVSRSFIDLEILMHLTKKKSLLYLKWNNWVRGTSGIKSLIMLVFAYLKDVFVRSRTGVYES